MANMRIDDYGGWPRTADEMLKSKNRIKSFTSAEGAGGISDYPDTEEMIKRDQDTGIDKLKNRPMKSGYRN